MENIERKTYPYNVDEYVAYGNRGIFRIVDIRKESFGETNDDEYYVMQSVFDERSQTFLPVGSAMVEKFERVLTPDEINAVIDSFDINNISWTENAKERETQFAQVLSDGGKSELLRLFITLYIRNLEQEQNKRRMYASDAKTLAYVKRIITEEYAFILGIPKDDVVDYIKERLSI